MKEPTISIIVPTYNRADMLGKALISLDEIDYPKKKYEVIVVNDGSKDNTEKVVSEIRKKVGYKLKYLFQENKRLSAARNLAIKNSSNEIIVSVDDDMLFPKAWIRQLIQPLLEDETVGAVGGPSVAPESASFFQRCVDHCMTTSFLGTGGMIGTTKNSFVKYWPRGGNMAVRKKILDKIGLFDEKFIPSEEIDLDRRIEKAGYKLALAKEAKVWHMPRTSFKGFVKQIYTRGVMKTQFLKRYKETFEWLYFAPMAAILMLILLIVLSFFSIIALVFLVSILILYIVALLTDASIASKRIKKTKAFFLVPVLMFLQHLTYGLGTIRGFLMKKS